MAFAVLMNADAVLVKHYLPDNTEFAYAATLGRIAAFLPAAAAMIGAVLCRSVSS